uniref:Apolipoprotein F n=1 Tax=Geotrypetes seraphini TaxID=260995 RepID=A0A6P8Q6H4_GEOSA|nr:apolipoprotein F [Geotrypetes seraphini]XP_033791890.1 apolipoprotein F [Geotrypetes seraphini]XP_033791892.1 apolipoprotein F [Geotrypetes seraphini]
MYPFIGLCLLLLSEQLSCLPQSYNDPRGAATEEVYPNTPESPRSSLNGTTTPRQAEGQRESARTLLSTVTKQLSAGKFELTAGNSSCQNFMPLQSMTDHLLFSRDFINLALVVTLGGLGCQAEAESLILQLYEDLGKEDTNKIFLKILDVMNIKHSTPVALGQMSQPDDLHALLFNIEQMPLSQSAAGVPNYHCTDLDQVNGSHLLGSTNSIHASYSEAASACQRLGYSCAGIAANETGLFSVIKREHSYFLPHQGCQSWLHHCTVPQIGYHRVRRQEVDVNCNNENEQEVHKIIQWIPAVSTLYHIGTTVYYAVQNCKELAKERALEAIIDVGYDALVAATGNAVGIAGYALKPRIKDSMQNLLNYFNQPEIIEQ